MDYLGLIKSRSLQTESVIYFIISLHLILQMYIRILKKLYTPGIKILHSKLYKGLVPKFQKVVKFKFFLEFWVHLNKNLVIFLIIFNTQYI